MYSGIAPSLHRECTDILIATLVASDAHIPFFIGDATSSGNDGLDTGPVVGGVLSLVIILISGVSGLVIVLLILKMRSLTPTHQ